jgi:REP element-mobilizing transposase RayT
MAYTKLIYHIVFRPHWSVPAITEVHERDLFAFVNGFCNNHKCKLIRINSMPDHIHILVSLPPTMAVASFVHDLKIAAGNFLRAHPDKFPLFTGWARSYYAGTCGPMDKERVRRYIMRQKEHHKKKSYKQEILRQLKRAGIEYDEKYLFRD